MQKANTSPPWFDQVPPTAFKPPALTEHPAFGFLKSVYDKASIVKSNVEIQIPCVVATNDWSETVYYAEGYLTAQEDPQWGHILGGTLKGYYNNKRYGPDNGSHPFDAAHTDSCGVVIRVAPFDVKFKFVGAMGMLVLNPTWAPHWDSIGPNENAGVLFGLEETPSGASDKAHYPKTMCSV